MAPNTYRQSWSRFRFSFWWEGGIFTSSDGGPADWWAFILETLVTSRLAVLQLNWKPNISLNFPRNFATMFCRGNIPCFSCNFQTQTFYPVDSLDMEKTSNKPAPIRNFLLSSSSQNLSSSALRTATSQLSSSQRIFSFIVVFEGVKAWDESVMQKK